MIARAIHDADPPPCVTRVADGGVVRLLPPRTVEDNWELEDDDDEEEEVRAGVGDDGVVLAAVMMAVHVSF